MRTKCKEGRPDLMLEVSEKTILLADTACPMKVDKRKKENENDEDQKVKSTESCVLSYGKDDLIMK